MNQNDVEKQMAAMQQRLEHLEREARPIRLRRTVWGLVVGLIAGTAIAATWPANFQAGSPAKAADLNSYLNDLYGQLDAGLSARGVPSGAVSFFNLGSCPPGWSPFVAARGRTIVGNNIDGGTPTTVGNSLANGTLPTHAHRWSSLSTNGIWRSYNAAGAQFDVINWSNGMNEGTGTDYFPFATSEAPTSATTTYYTSIDPAGMPYVQLLACSKD